MGAGIRISAWAFLEWVPNCWIEATLYNLSVGSIKGLEKDPLWNWNVIGFSHKRLPEPRASISKSLCMMSFSMCNALWVEDIGRHECLRKQNSYFSKAQATASWRSMMMVMMLSPHTNRWSGIYALWQIKFDQYVLLQYLISRYHHIRESASILRTFWRLAK